MEISRLSGTTASLAIIIILVVAMAGLGLVVVNSLAESSWAHSPSRAPFRLRL